MKNFLFLFLCIVLIHSLKNKKKQILMIYSGGTIGMKQGEHGWQPESGYLQSLMANMPQFQSESFTYYIDELSPLLDSSAMTPKDWTRMANVINQKYNDYDGFIVLHGTDTLAYTSSILSFMFKNLNKTIVVTGAQTPLCQPYSDATNNIISALQVINNYDIPEVVVTFGGYLLRGNRIQKLRANSYQGFDSADFPYLGLFGAETLIDFAHIRDKPTDPMEYLGNVSDNVAVIYLFPGITVSYIQSILNNKNLRGIIFAAFGAGNGPDKKEFLDPLEKAIKDEVVIVDVTQCHMGSVDLDDYGAAFGYKNIGIISGGDMTLEAAFTKLSWLLGQNYTVDEIKDNMQMDLRGELTLKEHKNNLSLRNYLYA